jgi:hypothetical protein
MAAFSVPALAATNPFMDVPASHWAYDAVAQLASRGIISGYPDGSYKGGQPATRYEMASIIARGLAQVDMDKASKADVELMRKLIIEFKDELDALGARVDSIDERLGVIETDIGGWSIAGEFRFDANFGMDEEKGWYNDDGYQSGKNDFDLNRFRIFLNKRINETTSFYARLGVQGEHSVAGNPNMTWERYSITTKLGYDVTLTAGLVNYDFEDEEGLYNNNDALFGDFTTNGFALAKNWGRANLLVVLGRMRDDAYATGRPLAFEAFLLAGKLNFDISEKLNAGLIAYYHWGDDDFETEFDTEMTTFGVYFGYNFTPDVALRGLYYYQFHGEAWDGRYDDPFWDEKVDAWRVIVDVNQDALKFTSLWLEYNSISNNFYNAHQNVPYTYNGAGLLFNSPWNDHSTKLYGIHAGQKWNDKWDTFLAYYSADYGTDGVDNAKEWTVGVGYQLNPAVKFELSYDNIDYGDGNIGNNLYDDPQRNGDDHQIRFRTFVSF